jgi:hypothetical protein
MAAIIIVLAVIAIIITLAVVSFAVHFLLSPWLLLLAVAILAWLALRPRRRRQ